MTLPPCKTFRAFAIPGLLSLAILVWFAPGCSQTPAHPNESQNPQNQPKTSPSKPLTTPAITPAQVPLPRAKAPSTSPRTHYKDLRKRFDQQVAEREQQAQQQNSWIRLERLASAYMQRARLTGDWNDYQKADRALQQAFALAAPGAGPFMMRARLSFTLHRFPQVDNDLDKHSKRLLLQDTDKSAIATMRADVALYRGKTQQAQALYQKTLALSPRSMQARARQAHFYARLGNYEKAEEEFDRAVTLLSKVDSLGGAWLHLQRGLLDLERNQLDRAMAHYQEADATLKGWWLVEEHMAEIHALQGRHDEAQRIYRTLVEQTKNPELMGALAESLEATNHPQEALQWHNKAVTHFEKQLALFPEAAGGHALEYFLSREPTSARTLALAKNNHALRPGTEASLLLAKVYMERGDLAQAQPLLQSALHTGWKTPDLFTTHAQFLHKQGNITEAVKQCKRANTIAPQVCNLPTTHP